jgi:hypothetical protein
VPWARHLRGELGLVGAPGRAHKSLVNFETWSAQCLMIDHRLGEGSESAA